VACYEHDNIGVLRLPTDETPAAVAATVPFEGEQPCGMAVHGHLLLVAGGRTVQAFDISRPRRPQSLGSVTSDEIFPGGADSAHDLVYVGGHILATAQNDHRLGILETTGLSVRALAEA